MDGSFSEESPCSPAIVNKNLPVVPSSPSMHRALRDHNVGFWKNKPLGIWTPTEVLEFEVIS